MREQNILEIIEHISPTMLSYEEWLQVGMALKDAGHTAMDWANWSKSDARYHDGECYKKWDSFRGSSNPVTAGTIVHMAMQHGWTPPHSESHALDWDDVIGKKDDLVIVERGWVETKEVAIPDKWEGYKDLIKYLETLFEAGENVGYVTETYLKEEKHLPKSGKWKRTASQLIEELSESKGDIGAVLGDYKEDAGAWIRFNPLDGHGCKNENVTEFRYALVESDTMSIDDQNTIIRELELPVACLVHSGGKSLHAIVRVEAKDYDEYRRRVDYLYNVCRKNGLIIDVQNKNPSRLSRMPGVTRKGEKQFLVDTNIGKKSWNEWNEWIESINDDLPEPEALTDTWENLPELSPPLIDGILRQGHKLLLAGPSKAGKSFSLIEMTIAIAEGRKWLGFDCTKGRVLYVNLELDRASCLHRFRDVYNSLGWNPQNLKNIDIWNLRGKSVPMDKLAPKLIRRASKKDYIAIIIDPIYKVITGDENSADQMAHFCNQFDLVCYELGAAVIYCHHHSKGHQGAKRSVDRASGSGVFARDPDALLDLIELELTDDIIKQQKAEATCRVCTSYMNKYGSEDWDEDISQDTRVTAHAFVEECKRLIPEHFKDLEKSIKAAEKKASIQTGWRIEGTLREYPKFPPVNLWFDYPIHCIDEIGVLKSVEAEGEAPPWKKNLKGKKDHKTIKEENKKALETAYDMCMINGQVTINDLTEYMGVSEKTVRRRVKEHGIFWIDEGVIGKKTNN